MATASFDPHPLFPLREGDTKHPEIASIRVARYEQGRLRYSPLRFGPGDLQDWADVYELFGGGVYELEARDSRNKISRKERQELAGPPRPLFPPTESDPAPGSEVGAPFAEGAVRMGAALPFAGGMSEGMLAMMMNFMKMAHEANLAQQQTNSQILVALLNRGQDASKDYVAAMGGLQSSFMEALSRAHAGGGGADKTANALLKGVELAAELRAGAEEGAQDPDESTLAMIIEGLKVALSADQQVQLAQAMQARAAGQVGPPSPQAPPPGNGAAPKEAPSHEPSPTDRRPGEMGGPAGRSTT